MADYYPLLAKAVDGLPDSSAEARHAVYERARGALFGQLRNLDPPVPEEAIEREAQALERAVAQLETEITSRSPPESAVPPAETDFAAPGPPASAVPASEPGAAPFPRSGTPAPGPLAHSPSARLTAPPGRTPRPPTPLGARRDPPSVSPAARPGALPGMASNLAGQVPLSVPSLHPAVPSASKSPATHDESQNPAAGIDSRSQTTWFGAAFQPIAPQASGPESAVLNAPSFEMDAPEASSTNPGIYEPAARTRLEAQRPFAPRPEGNTGAAKRFGIVAGIAGLVIALVAIAAYKLRDRPEDLVRLQPSSTIQGEAGTGGKIVDRIGAGAPAPGSLETSAGVPAPAATRGEGAKSGTRPINPPVAVARRAGLLIEAPEEQSGVKEFPGTVVWRIDNVSNGPDAPLSTAVRAEIDIPQEKLQATVTIQKNFDRTLPASHTMTLLFAVPPDSSLGNIKQIGILQMRREDAPTGESLKGIAVPVTENSFLIGFARGNGEASNLDLLRSREWFDIPMVLANGHIAKLTFEKGPSGRSALDDAMASWQAQ